MSGPRYILAFYRICQCFYGGGIYADSRDIALLHWRFITRAFTGALKVDSWRKSYTVPFRKGPSKFPPTWNVSSRRDPDRDSGVVQRSPRVIYKRKESPTYSSLAIVLKVLNDCDSMYNLKLPPFRSDLFYHWQLPILLVLLLCITSSTTSQR